MRSPFGLGCWGGHLFSRLFHSMISEKITFWRVRCLQGGHPKGQGGDDAATQNPTGPGSPQGPLRPPTQALSFPYRKHFCRCRSVPNFKKNVTLEAQLSKDAFEVVLLSLHFNMQHFQIIRVTKLTSNSTWGKKIKISIHPFDVLCAHKTNFCLVSETPIASYAQFSLR